MVQDESVESFQPAAPVSRLLLFGGVALACALGAGVGLWARPGAFERPGPPKALPTALPVKPADRRLAIVVDDTPAPIGKPLDVLSRPPPRPAVAAPVQAPTPARRRPAAEPLAPTRPPTGLVRVVAAVPGPLAAAPPRPLAPAPEPIVAARSVKLVHPVKPAKTHMAAAAAPKHAAKLAKLEASKAERLAAKARRDRHRAHQVEFAEAAPPAPKPRHGLAALAHAFARLAPHHAKPEPVEDAEVRPRHKPRKPETRLARGAPKTEKPARVRLASARARCASPDPGEALACGDPALGAAGRRLDRAYRDAEAAGVPATTLERQQQRWRTARAAAAREAPWAVREVYQARIAELQDQARDARGN